MAVCAIQLEVSSGSPPNIYNIFVIYYIIFVSDHWDYSILLSRCGNPWRTNPMPWWRWWLQLVFRCPLSCGFDHVLYGLSQMGWKNGPLFAIVELMSLWNSDAWNYSETSVKVPWTPFKKREPHLKSVNHGTPKNQHFWMIYILSFGSCLLVPAATHWDQRNTTQLTLLNRLPMAPSDAGKHALAKAAERAQRLAELDSAQCTTEKLLNFALPPEQLPWGEPLPMSQLQRAMRRLLWL